MSKCNVCEHNYKFPYDTEPACNCMCENYNCFEPITRFDWIKSMSCAEFADYLSDVYWDGRNNNNEIMFNPEKVMQWLQEPIMEVGSYD